MVLPTGVWVIQYAEGPFIQNTTVLGEGTANRTATFGSAVALQSSPAAAGRESFVGATAFSQYTLVVGEGDEAARTFWPAGQNGRSFTGSITDIPVSIFVNRIA